MSNFNSQEMIILRKKDITSDVAVMNIDELKKLLVVAKEQRDFHASNMKPADADIVWGDIDESAWDNARIFNEHYANHVNTIKAKIIEMGGFEAVEEESGFFSTVIDSFSVIGSMIKTGFGTIFWFFRKDKKGRNLAVKMLKIAARYASGQKVSDKEIKELMEEIAMSALKDEDLMDSLGQ